MPAPRWLARFNRRVTNRILGLAAPYLPWFGVIEHRGRESGRQYSTPVNVFRRGNRYIIALIYGRDSEWVRNVLANDRCRLVSRGRTRSMTQPRVFHDEQRQGVPLLVRPVLRVINVNDFMELTLDADSNHGA